MHYAVGWIRWMQIVSRNRIETTDDGFEMDGKITTHVGCVCV